MAMAMKALKKALRKTSSADATPEDNSDQGAAFTMPGSGQRARVAATGAAADEVVRDARVSGAVEAAASPGVTRTGNGGAWGF
jgi:hypothetical protein